MRLLYLLIITVFLLSLSCKDALKLSAREQKGVEEVLSFYGGECKYSKGFRAGTAGKSNYFELEVSKVEFPDVYENISELPASNIAYLFYKHLDSEKEKYSFIKSVVKFNSGKIFEKEFPVKDLEAVVSKGEVIDRVLGLLRNAKYDEISSQLANNTEIVSYDKGKLIQEIKRVDAEYGVVKNFHPLGFRIRSIDGRKILHYSALTTRDKGSVNFSIDIDIGSNEILVVRYTI
jgi:hypothetical protein